MDILNAYFNEGNLGLIRAAQKYDVSLGKRFSTYATWWITRGIREIAYYKYSAINLPDYLQKDAFRFKRKVDSLEKQKGRFLSIEEISKAFSMPIRDVQNYQMYLQGMLYLDQPIGEDDLTLKDVISSDESIEDEILKNNLSKDIESLFECLNPSKILMIKMRFGLGKYNGHEHRLDDIGREFSITKQAAGQIIRRALEKMQRYAKSHRKVKELKILLDRGNI